MSRILPENLSSYLSKNLMTFLVIDLFSGFQPLTLVILYRCLLFPIVLHLNPLYTHLHPIFPFPFYTLLSTLITATTTYTFYFFLLHHCTNSLSSLHIFLHHCTFCASLHAKTSPA